MQELLRAGKEVAGLCIYLAEDSAEGHYLLSVARAGVYNLNWKGNARVLDEFTDLQTAEEMLKIATQWLGSDELTQAFIKNTENAIIDSWQDYSLIDHEEKARDELAELKFLPMFGMF